MDRAQIRWTHGGDGFLKTKKLWVLMLDVQELNAWIMTNFEDVVPQYTWGEHSYFYNPSGLKPRGSYFLTIKQQNGANDTASNLDRPGVWRLNFGLPKANFMALMQNGWVEKG